VLTSEESILVNSFDANGVDDWSDYYGHQVKLAGLGKESAEWTRDKWAENGFDAALNEYHVYLSYPVSQSLSVTFANGTSTEVKVTEDALPEDDTTGIDDISQKNFHGYSASGSATAEYVYAGRGSRADFDRLVELGVELEGKIALVKYGGLFRGLKVRNAQDRGMVGCIIFTDPGDDGNMTAANGHEAYPDGPARNPWAVQKGSVLALSIYPGDPTTPGYPSIEGAPRADPDSVVPKIPSLPISFAAAEPLLQALNGHGASADQVNRTTWVGGLDADYSSGPAPGVTLSLENLMEEKITPIWNVIGIINGTDHPDETLIVGNHRDTWMIGGNGDPNSGSAILIEFTRALGKLLATGWKPKRNLVLASWDAEEYGLVGSTEWVEEHANWLTETAIAYLNIDVAVSGPRLDLASTPEFHTVASGTLKKVIDPNFGGFNQSLYDGWFAHSEGNIGVLGSGSDYTGFLHRLGINSIDMGSNNGPNDPVWHYHSNYDSYHWMSTFGDPGFHVHAAMGQYLTLLTYHLLDDELLPFDLPVYAAELRAYYDDLVDSVAESGEQVDLSELEAAIEEFEGRTQEVKDLETLAVTLDDKDLIQVVNKKKRDFQRGFVSQGGLTNREFYRHVVAAPGLDTGYAPVTFPGVTEALLYYNVSVAQDWVSRSAAGIKRAGEILKT